MKMFIVVARVAFIVALALTGVIWVTGYLAAVNEGRQNCSGHGLLEGYHARDFLARSLAAAAMVALVGFLAWGRSKRLRALFEVFIMPVFKLASMQVSLGMVTAYSWLFGPLSVLGLVAEISIRHYQAVLAGCLALAVSG